jgi:hypothetical protein
LIELNTQQQQALDEHGLPLRIVDPRTQAAYVLIGEDSYARLQSLLADETAMAELVDRVMALDDANDPYLAEYQRLYGQDKP